MQQNNDDTKQQAEMGEARQTSVQAFILKFTEERRGAINPTTSGTWECPDGSDFS
ncbi:MAG: hypothetical protein P1P90_03415 [Patescibacteria group bacterium]|nr:hypothetical protein [Patescibacteria group bacterium]